jgi:hypothetical protein
MREIAAGDVQIGEQRGFGHLDLQARGRQAGFGDDADDLLGRGQGAQLHGAEVEGEGNG